MNFATIKQAITRIKILEGDNKRLRSQNKTLKTWIARILPVYKKNNPVYADAIEKELNKM